MNFNHLLIFDAVATEKNITKAAAKLMISQPAVSKQLQLLEKSFGASLVERQPRGVRLTQAGEVLAGYARRLFALADESERALAELAGLKRGRLTIGASTTLGIYYLPVLLARYRGLHPQIDLDMQVANTVVIQQALLDHRVDVALTEGFIHWPELEANVFLRDQLVPIVPPAHALAKARKLTLETFCQAPLLMREQGSGTREVIEEALLKRGLRIKPLMTLGSTEAIKRSVAAGVGVAFVSALSIEHELREKRLIRVKLADFSLDRSFHIVQTKDRTVSPAAKAFLSLLSNTAST